MNYQGKPDQINVHQCLIVIHVYISSKFHEIQLWGYLDQQNRALEAATVTLRYSVGVAE